MIAKMKKLRSKLEKLEDELMTCFSLRRALYLHRQIKSTQTKIERLRWNASRTSRTTAR